MDGAQAFQAAVAALYKDNEPAWALCYQDDFDGYGSLIDFRTVGDPSKLPQFTTFSCPLWATQQHVNTQLTRKSRKKQDGGVANFSDAPAVMVFEVDYLLVEKSQSFQSLPPEEQALRKQLQASAMAEAFYRTGFPYAVLVHSGSKSIHAVVRLDDEPDAIKAFRNSDGFRWLQEVAWNVFGSYDRTVLTTSGRMRLVRTPGATRDNGAQQRIIDVGKRTTIADLCGWFQRQLNQDVLRDIQQRGYIIPKQSAKKKYWFRDSKWRADITREHNPGERGTHWMHTAQTLAMTGIREPYMRRRPGTPGDRGEWDAPWLWWASAIVFDYYSRGWFFSCQPGDWQDEKERLRWWDQSGIDDKIMEQRRFEGYDAATIDLAEKMLAKPDSTDEEDFDETARQTLPPVTQAPFAGSQSFPQGAIVAGKLTEAPNGPTAAQVEDEKKGGVNYNGYRELVYIKVFQKEHMIKMSKKFAGQWYIYSGHCWEHRCEEAVTQAVYKVMPDSIPDKHRSEVFKVLCYNHLRDEPWKANPNAVAFQNGTMRFSPNGVQFCVGELLPSDFLQSFVRHSFVENAQCPQWEQDMVRFFPDASRRSLLQEMFGYTLLSGQPFQAFFLLLGKGANYKSTLINALELMHGPGYAAVNLAGLGRQFALGTTWDKQVAVDADADHLGAARNPADNGLIMSVIKGWSGGDNMQVEKKNKDSFSVRMNPKLILSANKKPRLSDPTNAIWRRLKIIKCEVTVPKNEINVYYFQQYIAPEIQGIIRWAVDGLKRLLANGKFTTSDQMDKDLNEYQEEMDTVLQFFRDYMHRDASAGWVDIRPIFAAYRAYAHDTNTWAVGEAEFRNRLESKGVRIGKPLLNEYVQGIPQAVAKPLGDTHYWAVWGLRCAHPAFFEQPVATYSPPQMPGAPVGGQSAPPIQFPLVKA